MNAEDVGTLLDGLRVGLAGGGVALGEARLRVGSGEKAFARKAGEERTAELLELSKVGEQDPVFFAALAEAETWIEHNAICSDACGGGGGEALSQAGENGGEHGLLRERRLRGPLAGQAARVHDDDAATGGGERGSHGGVPEQAGDVVDNFGTVVERGLGGGCAVGVDGNDGAGTCAKDGAEHREDAALLFLPADGVGRERGCAGTGGFPAEVEQVRAVVEELEGVIEGGSRRGVPAAVGETVRREIDDAGEQRAPAERERPAAKRPVKLRPDRWHQRGHVDRVAADRIEHLLTFTWYGHLKFRNVPLWKVILMSWAIALFEYCLQVPANRMGAERFTPALLRSLC